MVSSVITDWALELLSETIEAECTHLAVGTDGTATSGSDTALKSEVGSRVALSVTDLGDGVFYVSATWTNGTGSEQTIREYGIFDADSGGNMVARVAVNDAGGGDDIVRVVPDGQDLTLDAWTLTVQ